MKKLLIILTTLYMAAPGSMAQNLITGFPTVEGAVYSVTESNGILYIGGLFSSVGGSPRQNLAAIRMSNFDVLPWSPVCDSTVRTIRMIQGTIYICGLFQQVNGTPRNTLAALDPQTGDLMSWNPHITFPGIPGQQFGSICTVDGNDTTLFIGGYFLTVDGVPGMNLSAVDLNGHVPSWWTYTQGSYPVNHVTLSGSILYVDYVFGFYGLDIVTQQLTPWNPNPLINTGGFTSLFCDAGRIYIAGPFEYIGSVQRPYVAQTSAYAGLPTSWNAGFVFAGTPFTDHISSMTRIKDMLVVAGGFQANTSQSYDYIALYDTAAGLASAWNPLPDGPVWTAYTLDGKLLLGGEFKQISGQSHPGLALYDFITGTREPDQMLKIRCFPNPAVDHLTILDDRADIFQIQVINSGGVVVNTIYPPQKERSITLNLSSLPAGLYCFRFLDEKHALIASEKIIKR